MKIEDLPEGLASSNAPRVAERLGSISAGKVLDVGTEGGGFIDTLIKTLKAYDSFVGVDYCPSSESRKAMESARKRFAGKRVRFLVMNAEKLRFKDESFDTVCISHCLHHLANIGNVMAEMKRVLKKGGNVILQEVYGDGEQTEAQKVDELEHAWEARVDTLLGITHNETLTRQEIRDIAHSLNLTDIEVFDCTHPVDCLFCERRHECEDPRNQATVHGEVKDIDEAIKRIEDYPDLDVRMRLTEEGQRIKQAIAEFGASPGSYLFIIGKK
jgi:SAM-dependent methyltransferase